MYAVTTADEKSINKTAQKFFVSQPAISDAIKELEEEIVEIDSAQIIPTRDDYDFFITNTNKALEAGIDSAKLFSEGEDSPYANIIAIRAEDANNPAIQALVDVLLSEDTQQWIADNYNGAVIPVIDLGN
jgi:D-methionine transport system substrate-binding protein